MRSFDEAARWSPAGRRWIVQIHLTSAPMLDLGDAYLAAARSWWPEIDQVLRPVPRDWRHLTLINTAIPTEAAPAELLEQLTARLAATAAAHPPVELAFGPAVVNTVAVELYVQPSPALTALRDALATEVAGLLNWTPEPQARLWRAHSAIAYCAGAFDDDGLQAALLRAPGPVVGYQGPARERIERVMLAATDPWAPDGRFWTHPIQLPLGQHTRRASRY